MRGRVSFACLPPEQRKPLKLLRVESVLAPCGCELPAIQKRPGGSGECTCGRPRTLVSLTAALTPTLVLRAGALSTLSTSRGTRALVFDRKTSSRTGDSHASRRGSLA